MGIREVAIWGINILFTIYPFRFLGVRSPWKLKTWSLTAKKFRVFGLRNSRVLSIALHLQGEFKRYFRWTLSIVALHLQGELCRLLRRANFVDIFVDNFAVFAGRTLSIFYCVFAERSVRLSDFSLNTCYLANVSFLSIDCSFLCTFAIWLTFLLCRLIIVFCLYL